MPGVGFEGQLRQKLGVWLACPRVSMLLHLAILAAAVTEMAWVAIL